MQKKSVNEQKEEKRILWGPGGALTRHLGPISGVTGTVCCCRGDRRCEVSHGEEGKEGEKENQHSRQ